LSLSSILFPLQVAAQDGPSFAALHEGIQLLAEPRDLSVQASDVPLGARELDSHLAETVPQVLFPQVQRGDLDRLTRVHVLTELGR
jgi:hypothetical protein